MKFQTQKTKKPSAKSCECIKKSSFKNLFVKNSNKNSSNVVYYQLNLLTLTDFKWIYRFIFLTLILIFFFFFFDFLISVIRSNTFNRAI